MDMTCRACGAPITGAARFCSACGTPYGESVPSPAQRVVVIQRSRGGAKNQISIVRILALLIIVGVAIPVCGTCGTCAYVCGSAAKKVADNKARERDQALEEPDVEPPPPPPARGDGFQLVPTGDVSDEQKQVIGRTVEALRHACPPLRANWGRIVDANVHGHALPLKNGKRVKCGADPDNTVCGPRFKRYGWEQMVEVNLTMDEQPGDTIVSGHTLHYWIGMGRKPGIVMNKRPERFLCGLPDDSGDDIFLSIPPLNDIISGEAPPDAAAPLSRDQWQLSR